MATDTISLTDLSEAEWDVLRPLLPCPHTSRGRPRRHSLRTILHAVFSVLRTGCAWRLLPKDLPAWQTVYHSFRPWRLDGTWERVHTALRERLRVRLGRDPQPSAGIIARPIGQDDRGGWAARLRRRQARHGTPTA